MHFLRQFRLSLPPGFCCLIVGLGLIIPELLWAYDQRDLGRLRNFGACVECNISEADLRMTKLNGANLRSSDMAKTIFYGTRLRGTQFQGAYFCNTHFGTEVTPQIEFRHCELEPR